MTRMEAEFVQREAPPSYGQLIAQGLIPPVEDFPVYNPTQVAQTHTETHTFTWKEQCFPQSVPEVMTNPGITLFLWVIFHFRS